MAVQYPMHLFPGETEADALRRRVKMHEYLMVGGVQLGVEAETGRMLYSPQIDTTSHPECPWHGEGCVAWVEIAEGRGYMIVPEDTRANGETLRETRERQERERDIQDARKLAGGLQHHSQEPSSRQHRRTRIEDARDTAEREFSSLSGEIPDEIEIDGAEEDDDEPS